MCLWFAFVWTKLTNSVAMCRTPVIVNRGWLPRKLLDAHIAQEKKEDDGKLLFVGVIRHGEVVRNFLRWK